MPSDKHIWRRAEKEYNDVTIQKFNENMEAAKKLDENGEDGKKWLASKGADEVAEMKAVATINSLENELEYILEVQTVIQNQYGYRLSL